MADELEGSATAEVAPAVETASTPAPAAEGASSSVRDSIEAAYNKSAGDDTTPIERSRDEAGRFSEKKKPAQQAVAVKKAGATTATQTPAAPQSPSSTVAPSPKAPQSWNAAERAQWDSVPKPVQDAILRREKDQHAFMQQAAEARSFQQKFRQVVAPFEGQIRAEGSEPMAAIDNLLRTASALRTAPPEHKATLVAQMVSSFGVPVDALIATLAQGGHVDLGKLDESLARRLQGHRPQAQQPQQFRDPRFDQLMTQLQANARAKNEASYQRAAAEVESFGATKDYFGDVRHEMADLLELHLARQMRLPPEQRVAPDLEAIYRRACLDNDLVRPLFEQAEEAAAAKKALASTSTAQLTPSSIRSRPGGAARPTEPVKGLRATLEAAYDAQAEQ